MTQAFDADRELLEAALRRHDHWLPLTAATCLSAAIDALTDPVVLPSLAPAGLIDTEDVRVVINDVRARLGAAARRSCDAQEVLLAGHAIRELDGAARALDIPSMKGPSPRASGDQSSGRAS